MPTNSKNLTRDLKDAEKYGKYVDDSNEGVANRMIRFKDLAVAAVNEEIPGWIEGQEMYEACFQWIEDNVELYNPTLLADIVQRVVDGLKLAPYILTIPGAIEETKQIVRDYITQIEQDSGLTSEIRDDSKGGLSWALLGNVMLSWGVPDEDMIAKGCPIKFQTIPLSQVYLSPNATSIRDYQGNPVSGEAFYFVELPFSEVEAMFPIKENKRRSSDDALTGREYTWGQLPFVDNNGNLQKKDDSNKWEADKLTQVGYYYDINNGIFATFVGRGATLVEYYDDGDSSWPDYPYLLDKDKKGSNGFKYIPISHLRLFPMLDKLYAKGVFHKFAKIARNDAYRRNLAQRYVNGNVNPTRFVYMKGERYATFSNQVDQARRLMDAGQDSYVPLDKNAGEEVAMADMRTAPLSQEFERMKADDKELISQGGISIGDVDYSTSERATVVAFEERNKNRLTNHVVKINAGESNFIHRVIVEFIKDYITNKNETLVATNLRVRAKDIKPEKKIEYAQMKESGASPEEISAFEEQNTIDTNEEIDLPPITAGEVADYIRKNPVFIKEDFSAWENNDYEISKLQFALGLAANTPKAQDIINSMLNKSGIDTKLQDLQPTQQPGQSQPQSNLNSQVQNALNFGQSSPLSK